MLHDNSASRRSGIADEVSRVSEIADDDLSNGSRTVYADYSYLGGGSGEQIVAADHPAVSGGLSLDYGDDGTAGLDRFGRVTDHTWTNADGSTTFDEVSYSYDRASNRLTRTNELHNALSESYSYDGLNRLVDTDRAGADWPARQNLIQGL